MANETVITVVGNLTGDPDVRYAQGTPVVNFTVASTPRTYNKQSNQWEDGDTLFLRCSAWRDMADNIAATLSKGMRVIVQGRLVQRSYTAKDGSQRTSVELQVDEIGPALRYATAQVARMPRDARAPQQAAPTQQGTFQPPQQDPWAAGEQPHFPISQGAAAFDQEAPF